MLFRSACSVPSSPPNPAAWVWDSRFAVRSWKLTVASYGPRRIYPTVPPFSSPCRRTQALRREVAPTAETESGERWGYAWGTEGAVSFSYCPCSKCDDEDIWSSPHRMNSCSTAILPHVVWSLSTSAKFRCTVTRCTLRAQTWTGAIVALAMIEQEILRAARSRSFASERPSIPLEYG